VLAATSAGAAGTVLSDLAGADLETPGFDADCFGSRFVITRDCFFSSSLASGLSLDADLFGCSVFLEAGAVVAAGALVLEAVLRRAAAGFGATGAAVAGAGGAVAGFFPGVDSAL